MFVRVSTEKSPLTSRGAPEPEGSPERLSGTALRRTPFGFRAGPGAGERLHAHNVFMGLGSRLKVFLGSRGGSAWIAGALVGTLGIPFLYGATVLGISARPWGEGASRRSSETLDYGRRLIALPPLREGFLRSVLGGIIGAGGSSAATSAGVRDRLGTPLGSVRTGRLIDRHLEDLSNDEMQGARLIPSVPYTAHADTSKATRPSSDPDSCSSAGGTVWYRFRPATTMFLAAYTFGTDHSVDLGAFRQTPGGSLVSEGCDRDAGGNAYVSFQGAAGTTYYFQIAAPVGGGRLIFSLDPHGTFTRATVAHGGGTVDGDSIGQPAVSDDGRYVAFSSWATNIVPGSQPVPCAQDIVYQPLWMTCAQIYLRDTVRGTTELISRSPSGDFGDRGSYVPNLSSDGRYVVFATSATNLGTDPGLVVHDRISGRTETITQGCSCSASINDDGRYVAFQTTASFTPQDTNGGLDVYVFDRRERKHELVSVDSAGRTHRHVGSVTSPGLGAGLGSILAPVYFAIGPGLSSWINGDGRYVAFGSEAPLVPDDHNGKYDMYVRDRLLGRTERVSVSHDGKDLDEAIFWTGGAQPALSDDGRYFVYGTPASNAVSGDTDGFNDIFVHDRVAKKNILASGGFNSLAYSGQVPIWPAISGDGRYVTYESNPFFLEAVLLVQETTYETSDVYRYDLLTDTTSIITQTLSGGDSWGVWSRISGDGRSVVFISGDENYDGDTTSCKPGGFHPTRCRNVFVYRAPR